MQQPEPLRAASDRLLFDRYAEAVPGRAAIEQLKALGNLVEIGAGLGYWACILQDCGGSIAAWDRDPQPRSWTGVRQGGVEVLDRYPGRAVFACWPYRPNGYMSELLERAGDRILALITAGLDSKISGDRLGDRLRAGWHLEATVEVPTWPARGDALTVWRPR